MKMSSPKLQTAHLTVNEEALVRCQTALELKDKGDYFGASRAMGPFWKRVGTTPDVRNLFPSVAAEVNLCVGILTRWIGSKNRIKGSHEVAKNLITECAAFFELSGDVKMVAAAHVELACCYWREGSLDEARVMLQEALKKLTTEGNTRARALLRLAIIEWSDSRFDQSLKILNENSALFNKITNHTLKGTFHNQLAMVLRQLAPDGKSAPHFKQVLKEYETADHHFKLAKHRLFRADVKNNIANLLRQASRFKEAHQHLDHARRLRSSAKDKVGVAQIDDTRAQVFIAEKKFKEAESIAKSAVKVLEKSGHQCLLTDALITHGIALARLKQTERAQYTFQKAIDVAQQVGALNKAGIAALTMIEESDELSPESSYSAYERASEWLENSQSQDFLLRLNRASRKVLFKLTSELKIEEAEDSLINKPCHLQAEVMKYEASIVRRALAQSNGSVTRAARLLGLSYQGLAYVISSRHKNLLGERSPVRRRARKHIEEKGEQADQA